jgi:NDP-sugar pyrophosphorylase family protein
VSPRCKALLLAGGLGTRLRPLTNTVPKCLVAVAGKPLVDYWFAALQAADVLDALINTHHLYQLVWAHLDAVLKNRPLRVKVTHEPVLLGSAGTVRANRSWMDDADECVIVYVDNLSNVDLRDVLAFHHSHDDPMTMMLFHTPHPEQCGIASLGDDGRVLEFIEKPAQPRSDLANAGLYVVSADAYREIADRNVFDFGFDVLPKFVGRMRGFVFEGYHRDIGSLEAWEQAERDAPRVFGSLR